MEQWFVETWVYTILLSILYGAAIGWLAKEALHYASGRKWVDRESFLVFAIALALFITGTCGMIGSDDVLACFIAGNAFTWDDCKSRFPKRDPPETGIDKRLLILGRVQEGNRGRQFTTHHRHAAEYQCILVVWGNRTLGHVSSQRRDPYLQTDPTRNPDTPPPASTNGHADSQENPANRGGPASIVRWLFWPDRCLSHLLSLYQHRVPGPYCGGRAH
jgi:Sodium/hydrogen exchanger family